MILPFLNGFLGWSKAPVTWILLAINTLILFFSYNPLTISQHRLEDKLKDKYFLNSQGRIYAQYIRDHGYSYSEMLKEISRRALDGEADQLELLGRLALRNSKFFNEAPNMDFSGDQVAIQNWKRSIASIKSLQQSQPSSFFALNSYDLELSEWFTYIFVHSGPVHFIGNMLLLLIFGAALEPLIGGLALLVVFLLSGALSAGTFLMMSGAITAPLVGASGAVSGLIAFFCFLHWFKPVRLVYWLIFPVRGCFGFVFLPGWTLFLIFTFSDLAGYLSTVKGFGGIAYSAHLGGEMAGVLVGVILALLRREDPGRQVAPLDVPMGKAFPIYWEEEIKDFLFPIGPKT